MYLRKNISNFAFRLNQLKLTERVGVLCCILLLPLLAWDLFFRQTQMHIFQNIEQQIIQAKQKSKLLGIEKKRIELQVHNPQTAKWLEEYFSINKEIELYKRKVRHYRQKTLSEKKLVIMLNAIFGEIKQLKMVNFFSISEPNVSKAKKEKASPKKLATNVNDGLMRKYYQLHLHGDFFSILAYLKKIENLPWQLYWDEMYYYVDAYPMANLELTFHAMSKENK